MNISKRTSGVRWPGRGGGGAPKKSSWSSWSKAFRVCPCVGKRPGGINHKKNPNMCLLSFAWKVRGLAMNQSQETNLCICNRTKYNTTTSPISFYPSFSSS